MSAESTSFSSCQSSLLNTIIPAVHCFMSVITRRLNLAATC